MTLTIHIVDDDDAVRESTRALLEFHGYRVHDHPSGEAFLEHGERDVGCLLVDQYMPGMKGLELLEQRRAHGHWSPALIITGGDDLAIAVRAAHLGVMVLRKPIPEELLLNWIAQHGEPR